MRGHQIEMLGNYIFTGKTLGKGHFGFVELALHTITKVQVAVKIAELHRDKEARITRNFFREVSMLKKLNHPGIVKIHESLRTKKFCCLVMEFVDGGDLLSYVDEKEEGLLEEGEAKWYFKQIVSVLEYLHKRRIVHRDLKMENILLQGPEKKVVKVIDFGLSNVYFKGKFLSTKCGSPEYAAPELFQKDCKYGTEVDIWSLGIILYGMLVGQLPFRNENYGKLVCLISRGLTDSHQTHIKHLSSECKVLLLNILQPDPQRRYSISNVMSHAWTCEGQSMLTPIKAPIIDPRIKRKVVTTVANLIGLSKSEVNLAVDLRKCDSVFAVYSILLQEEIKRVKSATKPAVPLNIQAHSNSTFQKINQKRHTTEKEKPGPDAISYKHKLRLSFGRRYGVCNRRKRCEKYFNEYTGVVGKGIEIDSLKQPVLVRMTAEKKGMEEIEKWIDDIKSLQGREVTDLKSVSNCEDHVQGIILDDEKHNDFSWNNDRKYVKEANDGVLKHNSHDLCKGVHRECSPLSNNSKSNTSMMADVEVVSRDDVGITEDQATEIQTPSQTVDNDDKFRFQTTAPSGVTGACCGYGKKWTTVDSQEIDGSSGNDDYFTKGRETKEESSICALTCVTLQVLDVEQKRAAVQRRPVHPTKYAISNKKDSKLNTIPSKGTVNPNRDLEEAIEERLKPCLKNTAASLRQRPRTANAKIYGSSTKSQMAKTVRGIRPRPKTAACPSRGSTSQIKDQIRRKTPSKSSVVKAGHETEASNLDDDSFTVYFNNSSFRNCEASKKPKTVMANSWFHVEDVKPVKKLDISGKKLDTSGQNFDVDGTTSVEPNQSLKTNNKIVILPAHQNYFNAKTMSAGAERYTNKGNLSSSISLVVGTGFKKPEKIENLAETFEGIAEVECLGNLEKYNDAASRRESIILKKNSEKAAALSARSHTLQFDSQKSNKTSSFESKVDGNEGLSRLLKCGSSQEEIIEASWNSKSDFVKKSQEHVDTKQEQFSRKNTSKASIKRMGACYRMAMREQAIFVKKWETVHRLLCSGEKLDSERQPEVEKPKGESNANGNVQKFSQFPTNGYTSSLSHLAPPLLLVPYPSVDKMEEREDFKTENYTEGGLNTRHGNVSEEFSNEVDKEIGGFTLEKGCSKRQTRPQWQTGGESKDKSIPNKYGDDVTDKPINNYSENKQSKREEFRASTYTRDHGEKWCQMMFTNVQNNDMGIGSSQWTKAHLTGHVDEVNSGEVKISRPKEVYHT